MTTHENPFLADSDQAEALSNFVHDLITTSAMVICRQPMLVFAWAREALAGALQHHPVVTDSTTMLRAVLHALAEFYRDHSGPDTVVLEDAPVPDALSHDPTATLMYQAFPTWVRAVVARDQTAADNVLKAIARELGPVHLPDGYMVMATSAVVTAAKTIHEH